MAILVVALAPPPGTPERLKPLKLVTVPQGFTPHVGLWYRGALHLGGIADDVYSVRRGDETVATVPGRIVGLSGTPKRLLIGTVKGLYAGKERLFEGELTALAADGDVPVFGVADGTLYVGDRAVKRDLGLIRDLLVDGDTIWVAGRQRDPREGKPVDAATARRRARALTSGRGRGSGIPFAAGYLFRLSRGGEALDRWTMKDHRPVRVVKVEGQVYYLSEGTPETMFRDAALFRRRGAPHAKRWAKVATGLIHEVDLAVAGKRLCLASSDGDAFEVICLSKTEVPTRVAKGPYMPWAFTATPTGLTWFESKVLHNEARGMVALDL